MLCFIGFYGCHCQSDTELYESVEHLKAEYKEIANRKCKPRIIHDVTFGDPWWQEVFVKHREDIKFRDEAWTICSNISSTGLPTRKLFDSIHVIIKNTNVTELAAYPLDETIRQETQIFIMNDNHVETINKIFFQTFRQMYLIDIKRNNILWLPEGLFAYEAEKSMTIDLSCNRISTVGYTTFNSTFILYLNLKQNKLANLNFILPPNIRNLELSSNLITQISLDIFQNVTKLEILRLENNHISTLPRGCFQNLIKLQKLSLANNKIFNLKPHGIFSGLQNLHTLNFSTTALRDVSLFVTKSLENLNTLDISNNYIRKFDLESIKSVLSKLETVIIHNNPIFKCSYWPQILNEFGVSSVNIEAAIGDVKITVCTRDSINNQDLSMYFNKTFGSIKSVIYLVVLFAIIAVLAVDFVKLIIFCSVKLCDSNKRNNKFVSELIDVNSII